MSMPVSKGPVVSLRMPVAVDRKVRERAAARGVSVGRYLAMLAAKDVSDTTTVAS